MNRTARALLTAVVVVLVARVAWSQRPPAQSQPGTAANPLIRVFDTNGDGTLSTEEIEGASAKLKTLDTSKDGRLSGDELRQAVGPGPGQGPGPGAVNAEAGTSPEKPPLAKDEA